MQPAVASTSVADAVQLQMLHLAVIRL